MKKIEFKKISLLNNETITYRQCNGGEKVIILVHGNLASSKFYEELMQSLSEEYTSYAIDMRGFGGSTYNRPVDTLRDFAGDLKLFVDQLGLEKFDLLGWSTGGAVSMFFCSSYGYRVNRLLLVASAGVSGYHSYGIDSNGEKRLLNSRDQLEKDPSKMELLEALRNKDRKYYKNMWDVAIYNVNKPRPEVYEKQIEESLAQKNLMDVYYGLTEFNISDHYNGVSMGTEEVNKINVPTIVVHGEKDLLVSVDDAMKLKESIGNNAKLVLLKSCGHSPMVDAPEVLLKIINES